MALSRAEIQRRYREKKKQESGSYVKKERERKRKAYVPVDLLTEQEAKKRRKETLTRVKRHYEKIKTQTQTLLSADNVQTRQGSSSKIKIKLDFKRKRPKPGKKIACNTMTNAAQHVNDIETINKKLMREKRRLQKKLERTRNLLEKTCKASKRTRVDNSTITPANCNAEEEAPDTSESEDLEKQQEQTVNLTTIQSEILQTDKPTDMNKLDSTTNDLTPRSKANKDLIDCGLTPTKHPEIKRKLLHFHVLTEEMKVSRTIKHCTLNTAKKYRCVRAFGRMLGVSRNRNGKKKAELSRKSLVEEKVCAFLEREDNCVTMPGKKDQKKKKQKRILTDYLHNLHAKFRLENPEIKISRSTFSNMRPKHFTLVNFCQRNTCLCSRHQNLALKIKAIQDVAGTKNPDSFIRNNSDDDIQEKLRQLDKTEVTYTEWKRVEENGKLRWKQVQTNVTKTQFVDMFTNDIKEFRGHVSRVKNQYNQMRHLRENLEDGHALVWMDFAENFTCAALDEVQSAYWTSEQVTLHTSVVYFPKMHHKTHKSVVGISDLNIHNAGMVFAMVSNLMPLIKSEYPDLKFVHYLTDSPTPQYRNKSIFEFLTRHESVFGVRARWDYLESGHGKGPCDGLGGSVKRSAEMAVKQGKVVIQNAKDFYAWAANQSESETSVSYYYVIQEMYDASAEVLKERNDTVKPIKGTFKLHAVVPVGERKVASRELSCNCSSCLADVQGSNCDGWTIHDLSKTVPKINNKAAGKHCETMPQSAVLKDKSTEELIKEKDQETPTNIRDRTDSTDPIIAGVGEFFCAAIFEDEWYVGKVIESSERKLKINFMEEFGTREISFRWPLRPDEAWVPTDDILMKVPEPTSSGSRKRFFKLGSEITDLIDELCEEKRMASKK